MNATVQEGKMFDFAAYMPATFSSRVQSPSEIYEQNRHRIYSLAFWMTDHELAAEEVMVRTFRRALDAAAIPGPEDIDRALISVLREEIPLGALTLQCQPCERVVSIRHNTLRVDLERAVVQLPATEKMIFLMHDVERYDHAQIARLLSITEPESQMGLHQARLRMRELLAK